MVFSRFVNLASTAHVNARSGPGMGTAPEISSALGAAGNTAGARTTAPPHHTEPQAPHGSVARINHPATPSIKVRGLGPSAGNPPGRPSEQARANPGEKAVARRAVRRSGIPRSGGPRSRRFAGAARQVGRRGEGTGGARASRAPRRRRSRSSRGGCRDVSRRTYTGGVHQTADLRVVVR